MGKSLVIVESPSKAKIINRYLGDDYVVKASVGHIRDLPSGKTKKTAKGAKSKTSNPLFDRMGINPEKNWEARYEIMEDKEKVVKELQKLAKQCDKIFLATDLDREGEAIAWHLSEVLGGDQGRYLRVKYPEITEAAILKAFDNPARINMDLVNAQQTRRFLDRVVGFMVSPLLWHKVARGLSAGRVQSVAVEIIVDREREIKAFIPQEYWTIEALTKCQSGDELKLALAAAAGIKVDIKDEKSALAISEALRNCKFVVSKIEAKKGKQSPPPPFITSTLQQTANQRLGFSVKRTMVAAQRLYESGLITYMRTDSVNLSQEAIAAAREIIGQNYGQDYLPPKPNHFKSKESAQEAHEAIRPSHPELTADKLPSEIGRDEQRLYALIYARYIACQMTAQTYETTLVTVQAGQYSLKASGRNVLFDGFRRVMPSSGKDEVILPKLAEGEILDLILVNPIEHFTQPPARFSEATLVKELEKDGIGRPSTYASIIATIVDRGYVKIERGRFYAEKMGEIVTDRLRHSFASLMDLNFTASMEDSLDEIASGKADWKGKLDEFYKGFSEELTKAQLPMAQGGMPDNKPLVIDMICPQCGKYKMAVHSGRTGNFLACLGYFDESVKKADRCGKTLNLTEIDLNFFDKKDISEEDEAALMRKRKRCPICDAAMDAFFVDDHTKLYICGTAPKCNGYVIEHGDFSKEKDAGPKVDCERCGSNMVLKEGRFGKYMACTNAECGNTRKILKNGEVAPPKQPAVDLPELPCQTKGSHFVLRDGATGIFLAAHNFPAVRETRAPLVSELKRFKDRISPKFYYLAEGPESDPEGNPMQVRYSRKTKRQYLCSYTKEGKATGYSVFYDPQKQIWEVPETAKSKSGAKTKSAKTPGTTGTRAKGKAN